MEKTEFLAPISIGEAVDKITILEIKVARLADPAKRENVAHELAALQARYVEFVGEPSPRVKELSAELRAVNEALWDIEDGKRDCERRSDFGADFIALARSVYIKNDDRARIKKEINLETGSAVVEEKSYAPYQGGAA